MPGPEVSKLFPCSTQLNTKFILLINVNIYYEGHPVSSDNGLISQNLLL